MSTTERAPTLTPVEGGFMVRMRCGTTARQRVTICAKDKPQALARYWRLRKMVDALVKAKCGPEAVAIIRDAAAAKTERAFTGNERAALDIAAHPPGADKPPSKAVTYREVVRLWLSGELARRFPGEVEGKSERTAEEQWLAYNKSILGARLASSEQKPFGDLPIGEITLAHLHELKQSLPPMSSGTRQNYCVLIAKPLRLALYPLMLIEECPVPDNFTPARGKTRAFTYLYPEEDAQMLGCLETPLADRVLLGLVARNGMRISEGVRLSAGDLDLKRGNLSLDKNKTKTPRTWKLDEDCVRALRLWLSIAPPPGPDAPIFGHTDAHGWAPKLRVYLKRAGVSRRELFATTAHRRCIRVHDLRASFVTLALAAGRGAPTTELWVRDRTGHTTAQQMETYRRWSRFALENAQGWFAPLDEAVPELAELARSGKTILAGALAADLGVGHGVGHDRESSINNADFTSGPTSIPGGLGRAHASDSRGFCVGVDTNAHGGPPQTEGVGHVLLSLRSLTRSEILRVAARCRTLLGARNAHKFRK